MNIRKIGAVALLSCSVSTPSFSDELRVGTIFSSDQAASQSFLRFYNSGTEAGTATVTLKDNTSGATLGQWTSASIPTNSEIQYQIGTVETESGATFTTPQFYTIVVDPTFSG